MISKRISFNVIVKANKPNEMKKAVNNILNISNDILKINCVM